MELCAASVGLLARQVMSRRELKLTPKTSFLGRSRAVAANILTTLSSSDPIVSKPVTHGQGDRITKADNRLRKFAENAEPGKCHTLNEIAEVMGVTRERVRQIEMRAKRNFRNRLGRLLRAEGVTPEDIADVLSLARLE